MSQNLPDHERDAKAQKAHRAAPPNGWIMTRNLDRRSQGMLFGQSREVPAARLATWATRERYHSEPGEG